MKQHSLLLFALGFMAVMVVAMGSLFSSAFAAWPSVPLTRIVPTPTPTPTPSPTPTPTLTPTDTPIPTSTPQLVNGTSAYLVDAGTNRVLLDVNSHQRLAMLSTTKIMTALLTIEHLPMDHIATIQQSELDEVPSGTSIAYLKAGDQLSVEHILYGLLLPSGSDAAVVLAHEVSGSTASFVSLMNTRAAQLGLNETHFTNPYGAEDPHHYSSAADLVKLAIVAMQKPIFATIVATPSYHIDPIYIHARYDWQNLLNPFLSGYSGADGIKTGSNGDGTNWCMVFSAKRNGRLLIGAEMQAPSQNQVFTDAENILTVGFAQ